MKNKLVPIMMLIMLSIAMTPLMIGRANASSGLGGAWHLDEETGNITYDSSGNGNHGTVIGGAARTTGKIGNAVVFDGVDDYIEVPDSNSLDITGKITLEAWIYPHTMTQLQIIVAKYNHSGSNGAYYLGLGGYGYMNKILFALSPNGVNFYYMLSNTNITANTWTHVAGTSNTTHMILYINGIKDKVVAYAPGVVKATPKPLRIGCYLPELGYPRFFDGAIDEVRVSAGTIWTVDDDKVQCPNADFTSIQTAINTASNDDTILVHEGTYNEALYINKRLTIKGASTPIIQGSGSFSTNYGDREAVIFVEDAHVVLESLDIEGQDLGPGKNYGIIYEESNGTIRNCIVSPNTIDDMVGNAIGAWDDSDLTVEMSIVENFGRIGVFYYDGCSGGVYDSAVEGQVYSDEGYVTYGIEIETYASACDIDIIGNEIYNCDNTHPSPSWTSSGILIDGWLSYYYIPSSTVVISGNNIHDNYIGIDIVANPYSYARYNNIYDNREYGVTEGSDYLGTDVAFDARFNWWGDASGPLHATTNTGGLGNGVNDNVMYSPWFGFVFGTSPMTYHVNPTGKIQDAIDDATSGDTILVHDGTYNEALYITKSLTIKAASRPVITGSQLFATDYGDREAVIFVKNAAGVLLEDLDIEGQGLGPVKSYGVLYQNSDGEVRNCIISPNTISDMNSVGIAAISGASLLIENCTIQNFGRIGVYATNVENIDIYKNKIIGQVYALNNLVSYGIEIEDYDGASTGKIRENEIYNADNTHPAPLWSSAAIIIDIWRGFYDLSPSNVSITGNKIHDNYLAIEVVSNPMLYAHCNSIYNNTYGVYVDPDLNNNNETFDARFNWWGHKTGPFHNSSWMYMGNPYGPHLGQGDNVGDYVLYDPWKYQITMALKPENHAAKLLGEIFSVNVTVSNVSAEWRIVAFQFRVTYDGDLLEVLSVTEGPFMKQAGNTFFIAFNDTYDPLFGSNVMVGVVILPPWNTFPEGSGVLATITFRVIYQDRNETKPPLDCGITLVWTKIIDDTVKTVPHNVEQGSYKIMPTHLCDLNYDGTVDIQDVAMVAYAFGSFPGHPRWDPICDLTGDSTVDIEDVALVAYYFGWQTDP